MFLLNIISHYASLRVSKSLSLIMPYHSVNFSYVQMFFINYLILWIIWFILKIGTVTCIFRSHYFILILILFLSSNFIFLYLNFIVRIQSHFSKKHDLVFCILIQRFKFYHAFSLVKMKSSINTFSISYWYGTYLKLWSCIYLDFIILCQVWQLRFYCAISTMEMKSLICNSLVP